MRKTPLNRGNKEMKRTPLRRGDPIARGRRIMKASKLKARSTVKKSVYKTGIKIAEKVAKKKAWTTKRADTVFSLYIRERDGACKKCGTQDNLTCSHFWRRGISSTRLDPKNCIALCVLCHIEWETKKNQEYKDFMIEWLGEEEYHALERRARMFKSRPDAVAEWKALYAELSTGK